MDAKIVGCFACFLLVIAHTVLGSLVIKDLRVPSSIESGTTNDVILDCDFDYVDEPGVVVKWFFNGDTNQIYQWISGSQKPGYPMGTLKEHIDRNFKASNDVKSMYRALKIKDVKPEMSGNYTCKVTGDFNEKSDTKTMIIYVPSSEGLDLEINGRYSYAICSANGIFPIPQISLYIQNATNVSETIEQTRQLRKDSSGLYNVTSVIRFPQYNFTNPIEVICELEIPGTNYFLRESETLTLDEEEIADELEELLFLDIMNDTEISGFNMSAYENEKTNSSLKNTSNHLLLFFSIILGFNLAYHF